MRRHRSPLVLVVLTALALAVAPAAAADPARPVIAAADLANAGRPCTTAGGAPLHTGYFAGELDALARADGAPVAGTYRFAIWAVGDKAHATRVTVQAGSPDRAAVAEVPDGVLQDGTQYAWHVRYAGAVGGSAWSPTCLFTYDISRPGTPTITPTNFPDPQTAPAGRLADFRFGSAGSTDVVGYQYTWNDVLPVPSCSYTGPQGQLVCPDPSAGSDIVPATADGAADVALSPPWWGSNQLIVRSIDAAGNLSPEIMYQVYAPGSGPRITVVTPSPVCGPLVRVRFTPDPHVTDVTVHTYSVANGPERTIRAGRGGVAAVTVPLPSQGGSVLVVRSHSADGYASTTSSDYLRPDPSPFVFGDIYTDDGRAEGGVGVTGTFDVYPPDGFDPAVDTLTYRFSDGTAGTVPAETGEISWTPATAGPASLAVIALDAGGVPLGCGRTYSFVVAG